MILNRGQYKGNKLFDGDTINLMYKNQLKNIGKNHGLGWEICQRRFMGKRASKYTFGKTGFTGCSVVVDIPREIGVVLLSNYIHPKRKSDAKNINEVRRDVADIVFSSI